jgi:hypothetical protein
MMWAMSPLGLRASTAVSPRVSAGKTRYRPQVVAPAAFYLVALLCASSLLETDAFAPSCFTSLSRTARLAPNERTLTVARGTFRSKTSTVTRLELRMAERDDDAAGELAQTTPVELVDQEQIEDLTKGLEQLMTGIRMIQSGLGVTASAAAQGAQKKVGER